MAKITFGFDGKMPWRDWKWTAYYEWGRTQESQSDGGYEQHLRQGSADHQRPDHRHRHPHNYDLLGREMFVALTAKL